MSKLSPTAIYRRIKTFLDKFPRTVLIAKVGIVYGILFLICFGRIDPDFGWHLQAGNYIRAHGIPSHDVFTYTARNFPWIDHEWGNDVLVSWLYQWGGYGLLAVVFAAIWTAGLTVFRRRIGLFATVTAALALMPYMGVRNVAWTVLFTVILLELIRRRTARSLILIPFLLLIWVNLHGGFTIGLALLAYYGLLEHDWKWIGLFILGILVSFINPYGPRLYIEVARTVFDSALHHEITEWRSFYLQSTTWPFIVLWGVGFWLYAKNKFENWLRVAPIMLAASLSASRNMPLFVAVGLRDIDNYAHKFHLPQKMQRGQKLVVGLLAVASVCVIGYFLYKTFHGYSWHNRETAFPIAAVSYLQTHPCDGNLFNDYNYGGYLIWRLPSEPVYIDGRMPSWRYPSGQTYIARYYQVLDDQSVQKTDFQQYNIRCVLMSYSSLNKQLHDDLVKAGWRNVVNANDGFLLVAPQKL